MSDPFAFDIEQAIQSGVDVAEGNKTWSGHDRGKTVGASEIGVCMRRVWYNKHGVPIDVNYRPDFGAAERGKAIEDWLVLKLQDALVHDPRFKDWELLYAGTDQLTLVDTPQSATPDGLLRHKPTGRVIYLEIKSQDPRIYEVSVAAKTEHKTQAIQGMGLVRRKTEYKPEKAILIYVNTSFVNQRRVFIVPYTEAGDHALRKRATMIMHPTHFSVDKPPMAEGLAEGGKECEYCAWREQCTLREIGRLPLNIKTVPPDVSKRLHNLLMMRKELLTREHDAGASKKAIEQEIVSIMEQHDTKRVADEWGSVSIYKAHSPPVVLRDKLEAAVGAENMRDFFRSGTPYIRINVALK